jgi:putative addiction module component (TIGR02574 family)
MSVEEVINFISSLPISEQLRVVQAILDRLPREVGTELTSEQKVELDRRWAEYKANPNRCFTEDEFRDRIRIACGQ